MRRPGDDVFDRDEFAVVDAKAQDDQPHQHQKRDDHAADRLADGGVGAELLVQNGVVMAAIQEAGEPEQRKAQADENVHNGKRQIGEHEQHGAGDVKGGGAELAEPLGAVHPPAVAQGQPRAEADVDLLDGEQNDQGEKLLMGRKQADQNGGLCKLVRGGIERLAEVGDHVEMAGDEAVKHIREHAEGQNGHGQAAVLQCDVAVYDEGHREDAQQAEQVRDGDDAVFISVFGHGKLL